MDSSLYERIKKVTALRKSRDENKDFVLAHPEYMEELVSLSFDTGNPHSHKACWILEIVAHLQVSWVQPHLDLICAHLWQLKNESAIRPMAKMCQLLVTTHFDENPKIKLTETHLQQITEICLDWLISDTKVAPKAYSIRALYILGRHYNWIYPELKNILEKNYPHQSPGYQAVAREILKKLALIS